MITALAYAVTGLVLLAYTVDFLLSIGDDPHEPRRIRPKVPLIGHILGLMQHGPTYYNMMSDATGEEIYLLPMLHFKIYISASPRLLPHIQKHSKALSFRPFLQIVARKHGDASKEAYDIFGGTVTDDLSHSVKMNLNPGESLDDLNLRMGKRALLEVNALSEKIGQQIYLLEWARHAVIQATSCAVYGDKHPFLDPDVETAFWKWQTYLTAHLAGWLDPFGTGYAARDKVFNAYIQYFEQISKDGSQLARDHQQVLREAGIPDIDNAKQAAIFTIASFSNSAPTLYWTLWELFSRPTILTQVRDELETHAITGSLETGFTLDVAAVKSKCPLLVSMFQETQRSRHVNPSFRKVLSDTWLDGKYLLKAGNYLQMPGYPIHTNPHVWGQATEFDPYRFVPKTGSHEKEVSTSGFVAWGAAPYLCPARQFAATEILVVAALMAIRYEMRPVGGVWEKSPALNFEDLSTLSNPKKDVKMDVSVRGEWAGEWRLKMGESKSRISLASG
ncbi:hypothetical protein ASPWEDRAFT_55317 [Aspergillus wentii DTO 134E9]|uniref:Cytochrome P450 n=1 Tax=Aspergillus wentii DTO 134E9 TaxID=1073089 RepID=A0A1L9R489_ASPWE|nr:uncharacterized protein ASPWEDRAFT_55317 [Aspergillus wentii DTO 134E9]KAI9927014.1 hypothetical protein MW887_003395 [Aspergillus wentii]OJJ29728.1 hypothetical protein ASPWEDRAFT_55317 [Aspergillus wentii DTO 134E9]